MKRGGIFIAVIGLMILGAFVEPTRTLPGLLRGEPFFESRAASYWLAQIQSSDPAIRDAAYQKFLEADSSSIPLLRHLLSQAAEAETRWTAAELLGKKKGQARDAAPELIQALNDTDGHVRAVAATAIPEVETPATDAVPALLKHVRSDAAVPVIRALSRYGADAKPSLPEMVSILEDQTLEIETRWNAARTIGKMREAGDDAIPVLVSMLKHEDSRIREHSAEALGDIGPPSRSAIDALVAVLGDKDTKVRRDAVRSIGQIGADASVIPEVEKLVKDPEAIVREAATKTLEQLRKQAESKP